MPEAIDIGKGLFRVMVRSKAKRKKLSTVPGVLVQEDRVIFGEALRGPVMNFLNRRRPKKPPAPVQTELRM